MKTTHSFFLAFPVWDTQSVRSVSQTEFCLKVTNVDLIPWTDVKTNWELRNQVWIFRAVCYESRSSVQISSGVHRGYITYNELPFWLFWVLLHQQSGGNYLWKSERALFLLPWNYFFLHRPRVPLHEIHCVVFTVHCKKPVIQKMFFRAFPRKRNITVFI